MICPTKKSSYECSNSVNAQFVDLWSGWKASDVTASYPGLPLREVGVLLFIVIEYELVRG